jgi:hypothetical protein
VELAEALLMEVNTDAKSMTSLMNVFAEFLRLNAEYEKNLDVALMLFVLDAVIQGLKASSGVTYGRTILAAYSRMGQPINSALTTDLFRILEVILAEEETEHALDITEELAWNIIAQLPADLQPVAYFMLTIGARCRDLCHLHTRDFLFHSDGRLCVSFVYTKNHRSRKDRYSVVLRPKFFPKYLKELFPPGRDQPLFAKAPDVNVLNRALDKVHPGVTSYSLRRNFIHAVIAAKTEGDVTAWLEVIKITGHHSLEVIRNSYAPRFQNTL